MTQLKITKALLEKPFQKEKKILSDFLIQKVKVFISVNLIKFVSESKILHLNYLQFP